MPLANDYLSSNIKINQEEDKNNQYPQKNEYQCVCSADWTGPDCSFKFERNCADDIDNDNGNFFFKKNSFKNKIKVF